MPSGNLDEPVTESSPQATPPRSFRFPAAYYTAPVSEVRPIFPKWVPVGCGTASAVILVLLFAGGALMTGSRLAQLMDFVLGSSLGDVRSMYAPDVSPAQKQRFDAEVKHLRDELRKNNVSVQNLQPFLKAMQSAISDKRVTSEEVEKMTRAAHDAAAAKPQTVK
ncbi:MAG TPA: hypothetical protein VF980_15495 [Thermoanaerobaculia bacterium]